MSSPVYHLALNPASHPLAPVVTPRHLAAVLQAARGGTSAGAAAVWALKIGVAPSGAAALVAPALVAAASSTLGGSRSFSFDTVSITTRGLEDPSLLREQARRQGLDGNPEAPPFKVADAEEFNEGAGEPGAPARGLSGATALAVLDPVRPHPHLGFGGVVAELGLGLVPRAAKLALHRDVRPAVDTPLCAGCGSCLDVCLFDAIRIRAGRAFIDHRECTGCGECMSACFMAGIAPEDDAGVGLFQQAVADSAAGVLSCFPDGGVYLVLLVGLDRYVAGPGKRLPLALDRGRLLAGTDPVAVDQAAWDLLEEACSGNLRNWHGYRQRPEALLARAGEIGLGSRDYRLVEVGPES